MLDPKTAQELFKLFFQVSDEVAAAIAGTGPPVKPPTDDEGKQLLLPASKSARRLLTRDGVKALHDAQTKAAEKGMRDAAYPVYLAIINSIADNIAATDQRAFDAMRDKATAAQEQASALVNATYNPGEWEGQLQGAVRSRLFEACIRGIMTEMETFSQAQRQLRELNAKTTAQDAIIDYDIDWPSNFPTDVPPWVTREAGEFTVRVLDKPYWNEGINETLKNRVRNTIAPGISDGQSMRWIANRLRDQSPKISDEKAWLIARTETNGAINAGHVVGIKQVGQDLGLKMEKEWMSALMFTSRDSHSDMDGELVGQDDMFTIFGSAEAANQCYYPGDENLSAADRCNCYCSIMSNITNEALTQAEELQPVE